MPKEMRIARWERPRGNLSAEVLEVYDFIESGKILRPVSLEPPDFVTIVIDVDEAQEMARSQEPRFRYPISALNGGTMETNWPHIVGDEVSFVLGRLSELRLMKTYDVITSTDDFFEWLRRFMPLEYFSEIGDDIHYDLDACIAARLGYGREHPFFEAIFQVYQAGGFPCGWDAENNRLFAFFPEPDGE